MTFAIPDLGAATRPELSIFDLRAVASAWMSGIARPAASLRVGPSDDSRRAVEGGGVTSRASRPDGKRATRKMVVLQ